MKKILIVSGHPDLANDSFANKIILEDIAKLVPEATIDDLGALYPDYEFDVEAEQAKLVDADIIVMQFPIFWFSIPALMAKWMEDVFLHGFSHGSTGKALVGKKLLLSFTTGAPAFAYGEAFPVEAMTKRLSHTAEFTGMEYKGYLWTDSVSYVDRANAEKIVKMTAAAHDHAKRLAEKLKSLA
ncbi:NAD(P)H-dependent oxidoreductase [Selenomonas sp. TAMA-11512]|uniref:NAD(P)H-dependent oxidoreductase n=1 Tax=Selenomonas sp. TAMA-11512 TaxID=3095337 RepID=UPI003091A331|nr:NAD(P)H-dependent oxidoreductase [Selenomonas sp. TAMA-11512]